MLVSLAFGLPTLLEETKNKKSTPLPIPPPGLWHLVLNGSLYLLLGPVHHRGRLPHVGAFGAVFGGWRGRLGVGVGEGGL